MLACVILTFGQGQTGLVNLSWYILFLSWFIRLNPEDQINKKTDDRSGIVVWWVFSSRINLTAPRDPGSHPGGGIFFQEKISLKNMALDNIVTKGG